MRGALWSDIKRLCLESSQLVAIVFWAISVAMHYRNEIREEMIRQRFLKALAVGKKYGLNELREGASKMFKRTDKDKSGALDVAEITSLLGKLGKDISISDINRCPVLCRMLGSRCYAGC